MLHSLDLLPGPQDGDLVGLFRGLVENTNRTRWTYQRLARRAIWILSTK
jgi:hypothetical protein